jgi:hypothetical protein
MPTEMPQRVRSIEDVRSVRASCLEAIWGQDGWPVANVADVTRSFTPSSPTDIDALRSAGIATDGILAGLWAGAEELSVAVAISGQMYRSLAYHFQAGGGAANRLVIVHHGHGDDFVTGSYRLLETAAELLRAGYSVLFMYMPNYGPAPRFPANIDVQGDRHRPIFTTVDASVSRVDASVSRVDASVSSTALRAFLEPVIACINYLCKAFTYEDFCMIGLSGGGWTTDLCAAIDARIRTSISVSGSLPLDLRFAGSIGDEEQMHPAFFKGVIGYRDLYTLAAYGNGRSHFQFLNEHDDCCFSDSQPPTGSTTLLPDLRKYETDIASRLSVLNSGHFEIIRFNDNIDNHHQISPQATILARNTFDEAVPASCSLLFYASSGRVAHAVIRESGHYSFEGETPDLAPGYTHILATRDDHVLMYNTSDGTAVRVSIKITSPPVSPQKVTGIGSGWTHLAAVGDSLLFLYSSSLGTARVGRIEADATFVDLGGPQGPLSSTFTHLAGSPQGALLLFDASAGTGLTGRVDTTGFKHGRELSNLPTSCTAVVAVNSTALFFYNASTGAGSTALFDAGESFVEVDSSRHVLPTGADHVVGGPSGALFLLRSVDATGATCQVDDFGEVRAIESIPGFGRWTLIAAG